MADKEGPGVGVALYDFLRHFFHDLATPLSAVSLHLEGAERRIQRGADPAEPLAIARSELSRAFDLFDRSREILFASTETPETFSFDEFVDWSMRQAGAPPIAVDGLTGGRVTGDKRSLSVAFQALVENAREASDPGSIKVRREREGGRLRVGVENPGRLPVADPETLFSPRCARSGRNWGMGLPKARFLAAVAGGTVRLEQQEDRVAAWLEMPEETT